MAKKTTKSKKPGPVAKLKAYPIQAAIWRNESENGVYHSVTFSRSYKNDNGEYRDADSYAGPQILQLSHLAAQAYERAEELNRLAREENAETEDDTGEQASDETTAEDEIAA